MILADLQTIEKALAPAAEGSAAAEDKAAVVAAVEQAEQALQGGQTVFGAGLDPVPLRELSWMTASLSSTVFNVDPDEITNETSPTSYGRSSLPPRRSSWTRRPSPADRAAVRRGIGAVAVDGPGGVRAGRLARVGFTTLGCRAFLTAGPKESRAWTIKRGATARRPPA